MFVMYILQELICDFIVQNYIGRFWNFFFLGELKMNLKINMYDLGKASKKIIIIFMEFSMEGYPPPRPPPVENN